MVFRAEQCATFEAIPTNIIMPQNPQCDPFHQFIRLDKSVALNTKDPTAAQIIGSLYVTKIGNIDVGGECFPVKCEVSAPP